MKQHEVLEKKIFLKKGIQTAYCGWWGFPNQIYHIGFFIVPTPQVILISSDSNVESLTIYTRSLGNWNIVWTGRCSDRTNLLSGEYKIECTRRSNFDAKAWVNYKFP